MNHDMLQLLDKIQLESESKTLYGLKTGTSNITDIV